MKIGVRLDGGPFRRIDALISAARRRAVERGEARRAARAEDGRSDDEMRRRAERRRDGPRR